MTLEEFRELAEAWGGDLERWPESKRAAARKLAAMPEAISILSRARRLDKMLSRRPEVSEVRARAAAYAVTQRLAGASARPERAWWRSAGGNWLSPAASLACSAALGVMLALAVPYTHPDQTLVLGMILDSTSLMGGLEVR